MWQSDTVPTVRSSLTPVNPERAAQVRQAAIDLFAEKGYRGTTINDIADVLGIRGPSLYKHVSSKQQVLREIVVSTMDELLSLQGAAIAGSDVPTEQLREMGRAIALYHVEQPSRAFVCTRELNSLEPDARAEVLDQRDLIWRRLRAVLDAGVASGDFGIAADRTAVATFCLVDLMTSPAGWFVEKKVTREQVADEVAEMSLRLVAAT